MLKIILIFLGIGLILYIGVFVLLYLSSTPFFNGATIINKDLSDQYYYKGDGIIFVRLGNFFELGPRDITQADKATFEVLGYNYAKDKHRAYHKDTVIEGADIASFTTIHNNSSDSQSHSFLAVDTNHVYSSDKILPSADAESFVHLWGPYSRDKSQVYYFDEALDETHAEPEPVPNDTNHNYLILANKVYFNDTLIEGADAGSFGLFDTEYSYDHQHVYHNGMLIKYADPTSFKIISKVYQIDKDHVFYTGKVITDADPESFRTVNGYHGKDKNHAYSYGSIILNQSPETISKSTIEKYEFGPKYLTLHYSDNEVLYALRDELTELGDRHLIYQDEVYYGNSRIPNADIATFRPDTNYSEYATDKHSAYYMQSSIADCDLASFKSINNSFSKDNKHVYYQHYKLIDTSPDVFEYNENMYGEAIDDLTARIEISE